MGILVIPGYAPVPTAAAAEWDVYYNDVTVWTRKRRRRAACHMPDPAECVGGDLPHILISRTAVVERHAVLRLPAWTSRPPRDWSIPRLARVRTRRCNRTTLSLRKMPTGSAPHSPRRLAPFAPYSLSEDLHFVERALAHCYRMLPISGTPLVYTRHASTTVQNTWRPSDFGRRISGETTTPPSFVDETLEREYIAAEAATSRDGTCKALVRTDPVRPLRFPYNLSRRIT